MANKAETGILKWVQDKGSVTVPPGEIAKRAGLEGANKVVVEEALAALRGKSKITTSMDPVTHKMTLRPVRVRA